MFSTMIRSIPFIRREGAVVLYLKSSSHHGENECILMYFRPFSLLSSVGRAIKVAAVVFGLQYTVSKDAKAENP